MAEPSRYTASEARILAWLERADFDGTGCRWSQENIAAACGCSRRTVIRATQKLADEGRIHSFLERRPGCKWPCRVYRVKHWNPHKRAGVLNVLSAIRERRRAECHTERTATATKGSDPCGRPLNPRCLAVGSTSAVVARASNEPKETKLNALTVGSLFSGIGGFDLGLERAGMRVLWQCESEPFCRRVLARHWPGVPCHPDVRELRGADAQAVDVLAGGFPCTDLSRAKRNGAGLDGDASGLWSEYARLVGELRPRYVIVENVAELLADGMGRLLGDLATLGYDAEWDVLPAAAFGAPHIRERVWLVAYPDETRLQGLHTASRRVHLQRPEGDVRRPWPAEPDVDRVAYGPTARLEPARQRNDRLRALGNALVPQIAEWIGRRIVEWELTA